MKNHALIVTLLLGFCVVSSTSCGGDDDDPGNCSVFWATELQDEINAIVTASTAYQNDPSQANCDALKGTYQAYLNALRPYGNCSALTGADRQAWQQAVDDAEDDLATIC